MTHVCRTQRERKDRGLGSGRTFSNCSIYIHIVSEYEMSGENEGKAEKKSFF